MPRWRRVLLKLLRAGAIGTALFAAAVLGIEVWKHGGDVTAIHTGFAMLVGVILLAGLWLSRAIGRELAAFPPEHGS